MSTDGEPQSTGLPDSANTSGVGDALRQSTDEYLQAQRTPDAMDAALRAASARNPLTNPDALNSLLTPDAAKTFGAHENLLPKFNLADYLQKQSAEFPKINPEEFKASTEKVARYISGKVTGVDGQPLADRAAVLARDSLRAEQATLIKQNLGAAAGGEWVDRRAALDALILDDFMDQGRFNFGDLQKNIIEGTIKPLRNSGDRPLNSLEVERELDREVKKLERADRLEPIPPAPIGMMYEPDTSGPQLVVTEPTPTQAETQAPEPSSPPSALTE